MSVFVFGRSVILCVGSFFWFWHAGRFQFVYLAHGVGGEAFALSLVALYAYKVGRFYYQRFPERVVSAEYHLDARIGFGAEQEQTVLLVLAQVVLALACRLEAEAFQVRVVLLVGIVEHGGPYLVGIKLLDEPDIGVVMVVQVEVGSIEVAVCMYHEDAVIALELA